MASASTTLRALTSPRADSPEPGASRRGLVSGTAPGFVHSGPHSPRPPNPSRAPAGAHRTRWERVPVAARPRDTELALTPFSKPALSLLPADTGLRSRQKRGKGLPCWHAPQGLAGTPPPPNQVRNQAPRAQPGSASTGQGRSLLRHRLAAEDRGYETVEVRRRNRPRLVLRACRR